MSGASVLFDAPGPRARARNRIATAATVVVLAAVAAAVLWQFAEKDQLTAEKWSPFFTANLWKTYLLPGLQGTLIAAALSIVAAMVLGFLLGIGRLSPHAVVRWPSAVFVEFFRAVPVLIMMIFSFALFGAYDVVPSKYQALAGVVTGLTLYNGAVIAEIIRAGVHSLPKGQAEAASALGMRWGQTMRSVQLPQAVTAMLPVLISQMVVVLKDTAIGYQILYLEVVRQATNVAGAYGNYIPALIVVALVLITINFGLSAFATWLERRLRRSRRTPEPVRAHALEPGD
ncbi:amino acid ABC transporter permease [Mycolicibacterium confluentis]|uniref:Glutamate ABC transporter permease n=1 Tax=Mycolicibacterium confluentis TaxID=28047 RepID=A0A7I7XXY3_9MYCO|nr:amino acid ABC transporter permease [Mycolicibacterium confluentis]MCV7317755.1 amino acid ABC transporter permease [Mycolicibacterium confluentis]ORV28182.1 glutamate ABC transporter permease [Mycolicibacterium confluentis]BBZ34198.1 glutamate ABC transporter permease [Mycolicibacterium confluentis]